MAPSCRPVLAVILLAALAGCAPPAAQGPSRDIVGTDCVGLFRYFDYLDRTLSTPRRERWAVAPEFMRQADRLRRADCITLTSDLRLDAAAPAPAAGAGGAAIAPIALHAGVVTNMADDAAARAFFEAGGMRARSVGNAALGRRIYLGPFDSEAALAEARGLAIGAGFAYPYTARF